MRTITSAEQKTYLDGLIKDYVAAKGANKDEKQGHGKKNEHVEVFFNDTFKAFAARWPVSTLVFPEIGLGGDPALREELFKNVSFCFPHEFQTTDCF